MPSVRIPLVPLGVALCSFALAGVTAARVNQHSKLSGIRLERFKLGSEQFCVQAQPKDKKVTIAQIKRTVDTDDGEFGITLSGAASLKRYDEHLVPTINGTISFNPIGQLVGALITIRLGDRELRVGLLEANPIRVIVKSSVGKKEFNYEFKVPGPIELKSLGNDTYFLTSPFFASLPRTSSFGLSGLDIVRGLSITQSDQCDLTSDTALETDTLFTQLEALSKRLPSMDLFPLMEASKSL